MRACIFSSTVIVPTPYTFKGLSPLPCYVNTFSLRTYFYIGNICTVAFCGGCFMNMESSWYENNTRLRVSPYFVKKMSFQSKHTFFIGISKGLLEEIKNLKFYIFIYKYMFKNT